MSEQIIYHNPRCRKSRETLELLQNKGIKVDIVEYLNTSPTKIQLKTICEKLGIKPFELIRTKETRFKELDLSKDTIRTDAQWITIMHDNPELIERPIVLYNDKVALGRPPENVLTILN